jgi:hypothetical protein
MTFGEDDPAMVVPQKKIEELCRFVHIAGGILLDHREVVMRKL